MQNLVQVKERIEKYIEAIPVFDEGERNNQLNTALYNFRRAFAELSNDESRRYALNIAEAKCNPPLPESEVAEIIKSVFDADITPKEGNNYTYTKTPKNTGEKEKKLCTHNADYSFDYTDVDGNVLYRKKRIEREGRTKTFRFESKENTKHVPYHLNRLRHADIIVIHEGELKADVFNTDVSSHRQDCPDLPQYVGTCLDCGSGSANQWKGHLEQYSYLTKKPVIIVADNDTAGQKYALATAKEFHGAGNNSVKIVTLTPDIIGGDYVDFQKQQDENSELPLPEFLKIVTKTAEYEPETEGYTANVVRLSDVKTMPINWIWYNRFPAGMLSMISGLPGAGKGFFVAYLVSRITQGFPFPDGYMPPKGNVLIFDGEEPVDSVLKPKIENQEADTSRVHILSGFVEGSNKVERPVNLFDCKRVEAECKRIERSTGEPVILIVIDPIMQFIGCRENSNSETQAALSPWSSFAERTGTAILFVNHDGKGDKNTSQQRHLGATSIAGKMRTAWTCHFDKATKERHLAPSKWNVLNEPKAIKFSIIEGIVCIGDCLIEKTADDFERETRQNQNGEQDRKLEKCIEWLAEYIGDGKPAKDISAKGNEKGYSYATIRRAKQKINIQSKKINGVWTLYLQDEVAQTGEKIEVAQMLLSNFKSEKNDEVAQIAIHTSQLEHVGL